jgi:hypothetical protein
MTDQPATLKGGWTGFRAVSGDDAAANTAAADLIHILDATEVPIVVLRRDLMIVRFNEAADVRRLSPNGARESRAASRFIESSALPSSRDARFDVATLDDRQDAQRTRTGRTRS